MFVVEGAGAEQTSTEQGCTEGKRNIESSAVEQGAVEKSAGLIVPHEFAEDDCAAEDQQHQVEVDESATPVENNEEAWKYVHKIEVATEMTCKVDMPKHAVDAQQAGAQHEEAAADQEHSYKELEHEQATAQQICKEDTEMYIAKPEEVVSKAVEAEEPATQQSYSKEKPEFALETEIVTELMCKEEMPKHNANAEKEGTMGAGLVEQGAVDQHYHKAKLTRTMVMDRDRAILCIYIYIYMYIFFFLVFVFLFVHFYLHFYFYFYGL